MKVAQMLLCYSRMPYVRAYRRESQEMMFDVHNRAFAHLGGSCERGIYDNKKYLRFRAFALGVSHPARRRGAQKT